MYTDLDFIHDSKCEDDYCNCWKRYKQLHPVKWKRITEQNAKHMEKWDKKNTLVRA